VLREDRIHASKWQLRKRVRVNPSDQRELKSLNTPRGHEATARLFRFLAGGAVVAVAVSGVLCARPLLADQSGPVHASVAKRPALVIGALDSPRAAARPDEAVDEKDYRERHLKRVEQRRLYTVAVFVGVILFILALWWSWGKLFRRPPKL